MISFSNESVDGYDNTTTVTGSVSTVGSLEVINDSITVVDAVTDVTIEGDLSVAGTTDVTAGTAMAGSDANLTVEGDAAFTGLVTVTGDDTTAAGSDAIVVLKGDVTATGGIALANGVVDADGEAQLVFNGAADQAMTGNITGTGMVGVLNTSSDATVTITGNVAAVDLETLAGNAAELVITGDLTLSGNLEITADTEVTVDGAFSGDVLVNTDGYGDLTVGASTLGAVGDATHNLGSLAITGAVSTASEVYADSINVGTSALTLGANETINANEKLLVALDNTTGGVNGNVDAANNVFTVSADVEVVITAADDAEAAAADTTYTIASNLDAASLFSGNVKSYIYNKKVSIAKVGTDYILTTTTKTASEITNTDRTLEQIT